MPRPRPGEDKEAYVSRFMDSSEARADYPDQKQRAAVAYSMWGEKKNDMELCQDCGATMNGALDKMTCSACGLQVHRPAANAENLATLCSSCQHNTAGDHDDIGCTVPECPCTQKADGLANPRPAVQNASDAELARMWDSMSADDICDLVPALADKAACKLPPSKKMYPWATQNAEVKRLWKEAYEDAHENRNAKNTQALWDGADEAQRAKWLRATGSWPSDAGLSWKELMAQGGSQADVMKEHMQAIAKGKPYENKNGSENPACPKCGGHTTWKMNGPRGAEFRCVEGVCDGRIDDTENKNADENYMTKQRAVGILKWIAGESLKPASVNMDDGKTYTIEELEKIAGTGMMAEHRNGVALCQACIQAGGKEGAKTIAKNGVAHVVTHEGQGHVEVACGDESVCPCENKAEHKNAAGDVICAKCGDDRSASSGLKAGDKCRKCDIGTYVADEKKNARPDFEKTIAAFEAHCKSCATCGPVRNAPAGSDQADAKNLCPTGSQLLVADLENTGEGTANLGDQCPLCESHGITEPHQIKRGNDGKLMCPFCGRGYNSEKNNAGRDPRSDWQSANADSRAHMLTAAGIDTEHDYLVRVGFDSLPGNVQAGLKRLAERRDPDSGPENKNTHPLDDAAKEDAGALWDQASDAMKRKLVDQAGLGIGIIQFRWSQMPDSAKKLLLDKIFGLENGGSDICATCKKERSQHRDDGKTAPAGVCDDFKGSDSSPFVAMNTSDDQIYKELEAVKAEIKKLMDAYGGLSQAPDAERSRWENLEVTKAGLELMLKHGENRNIAPLMTHERAAEGQRLYGSGRA